MWAFHCMISWRDISHPPYLSVTQFSPIKWLLLKESHRRVFLFLTEMPLTSASPCGWVARWCRCCNARGGGEDGGYFPSLWSSICPCPPPHSILPLPQMCRTKAWDSQCQPQMISYLTSSENTLYLSESSSWTLFKKPRCLWCGENLCTRRA